MVRPPDHSGAYVVAATAATAAPSGWCTARAVGSGLDGECEMIVAPCVFEGLAAPPPDSARRRSRRRDGRRRPGAWRAPVILTDLSPRRPTRRRCGAMARLLAGSCDAVLVGDHQDRADFPPSTLARLIADAGVAPWVTLACRDRNRITLEQELRALALDGLATVLCVTGDGRAYDVRPDVTQVFDLDGTRLAALAASLGLPVAVPETPTAPPVAVRPDETGAQAAGRARVGVLNHVPSGRSWSVPGGGAGGRPDGCRWSPRSSCSPTSVRRGVLTALPGLHIAPERLEAVLRAHDPGRGRDRRRGRRGPGCWGCPASPG